MIKLQKESEHKQQLIEKYSKKITEWEVRLRALLETSSTLLDIPNSNQMIVSNDSNNDDNDIKMTLSDERGSSKSEEKDHAFVMK